ncbi:MAG: DUF502 domain-containing protein [Rhodothalassiaceae bacterium]
MGSRLRTYFITGLVVFAPISITVYLIWAAIDGVDDLVRTLLPPAYNPETYLPFGIPGLGVVIAVVFLTALGALAANFLGRTLIGLGERIVSRMPIVRGIYTTLKQIFETVTARNARTFREVVLVEYPRRGLWAIAFVAAPTRGKVGERLSEDCVSVFLPTTPNPTSGFLLFVPRKDCIFLDMGVEAAVKYVISAGLVSAPASEKPSAPAAAAPEAPGSGRDTP